MPIEWTIDHSLRMVTAVARGHFDLAAVEQYLTEIEAAGGMGYSKLFDARYGEAALSAADISALGESIARRAEQKRLGPLAIVAHGELQNFVAERLDARANVQRPFRIFADPVEARWWLSLNELDIPRD